MSAIGDDIRDLAQLADSNDLRGVAFVIVGGEGNFLTLHEMEGCDKRAQQNLAYMLYKTTGCDMTINRVTN